MYLGAFTQAPKNAVILCSESKLVLYSSNNWFYEGKMLALSPNNSIGLILSHLFHSSCYIDAVSERILSYLNARDAC